MATKKLTLAHAKKAVRDNVTGPIIDLIRIDNRGCIKIYRNSIHSDATADLDEMEEVAERISAALGGARHYELNGAWLIWYKEDSFDCSRNLR